MFKVVLIIISFLLMGCNKVIVDKLPTGYFIELNNDSIDIYSDTKLSDIIKNTNISYGQDYNLDTSSLGDKIFDLKFSIDDKNYLYHIKYTIKDKSAPRILSSGERSVVVGSDIYLCDLIMYGDEYDNEPICRVEGEYDLNKVGKYDIKYIVSDSSNNETYFETKLNVREKSNGSNTFSKKTITYFNDIYNKHKSDSTKIGIDVSRWQGDIDFKKVKEAGAEFVIMRIGVEESIGKDIGMDSKYLQNIKNAKEAGLEVGVYLYSIALDKETAKKHAKWVIDTLDGEKLDLGITFDWESFNKWHEFKLSFHDINEIANIFIDTVKEYGYEGMLYSSKFYLENIWSNKNNYPVWLAHYTDETNYNGKYFIWQLCNDGRIDGINGDVDIDILYINNK